MLIAELQKAQAQPMQLERQRPVTFNFADFFSTDVIANLYADKTAFRLITTTTIQITDSFGKARARALRSPMPVGQCPRRWGEWMDRELLCHLKKKPWCSTQGSVS